LGTPILKIAKVVTHFYLLHFYFLLYFLEEKLFRDIFYLLFRREASRQTAHAMSYPINKESLLNVIDVQQNPIKGPDFSNANYSWCAPLARSNYFFITQYAARSSSTPVKSMSFCICGWLLAPGMA
jgi:hypothetical protein